MPENETLGNYRVLHLIGDGGFARVYLGEHLYLKTYAAIKVPKTRLDANDLEDFLNEARRGVGLRHPNVLRTLECGVQGGTQPYIIMEYAPGGSVSSVTQRARLCLPRPLSAIPDRWARACNIFTTRASSTRILNQAICCWAPMTKCC